MTKLKNLKCDKIRKLYVRETKKTQNATKINNLKCAKAQKLNI